MQLLVAFDKFKDSMTAKTACERAAEGLREVLGPDARIVTAPLTDGGEGFCPILTEAAGGWVEQHPVSGPLGETIHAPLGWVESQRLPEAARRRFPGVAGRIAIVEMASAAGLEQVPPERRHPRHTTTRGVGELIRVAAAKDAAAVLIGVGGSATSDLGLGALEALGLNFEGAEGILPAKWAQLGTISREPFPAPPLFIACDVDNPLCGPNGAAHRYGPQKGLAADEIEAFDAEARRVAGLLLESLDRPADLMERPGSGAAGGIGFGLGAAFDAAFLPGFPLVADWLDLEAETARADLVLSGEGKIDRSSLSGKGPCALARMAAKAGRPCRLFAGRVEPGAREAIEKEIARATVQSIAPPGLPLAEALAAGPENLRRAVAENLRQSPPAP